MKAKIKNKINNMKWSLVSLFLLALLFSQSGCEKPGGSFLIDESQLALYETLQNQPEFESFVKIIDAANLSSALNSHGSYTLFCPTNTAIDQYISDSKYSSLSDLLNDSEYVYEMARYHLVMGKYLVSDLGFGAIGDTTATGDFLVVSFGVESEGFDVIINNEAKIVLNDQEVNNGYYHALDYVLTPVIFDSYQQLLSTGEYTIFCEAIVKTGLRDTLREMRVNLAGDSVLNHYSLLAESNQLYADHNIYSYEDLELRYSDSENTEDKLNSLYQYMAFHIIDQPLSLTDFVTTNYSTFGDELMAVRVAETIWFNYWTTTEKDTVYDDDGNMEIIDDVVVQGAEPNYSASNMISKNGPIHEVTNLLEPHTPSVETVKFLPGDLPEFVPAKGAYSETYDNPNYFDRLNWFDTDKGVIEYKYDTGVSGITGKDYLEMSGLFTIEYKTDKLLAGKYEVFINVDNTYSQNATIQCYLNNIKVGGLLNLKNTIGSGNKTFKRVSLGTYIFSRTQVHELKVEAFIPGRFSWNYIEFKVVN